MKCESIVDWINKLADARESGRLLTCQDDPISRTLGFIDRGERVFFPITQALATKWMCPEGEIALKRLGLTDKTFRKHLQSPAGRALNAGNPVVFGTATGSNWNQYKAGDVLTKPDEIKGRHATCLVGYEDGKFVGENSWGDRWG